MTNRERIEDLGKLAIMLKLITENDIFDNCDSKHAYETWLKTNIKKDNDDIAGLYDIHCKLRFLQLHIEECYWLAEGIDDESQH
jgi:hypothetical protein